MSDESIPNNLQDQTTIGTSNGGRKKKQKVKIKYRERYRIKERPIGYKLRRFWGKHRRNIVAASILGVILLTVLVMIARLIISTVETNQLQKQKNYELMFK